MTSALKEAGISRAKQLIIALAALALMGSPKALAQSVTGNLYGKVVDESGVALPGVGVSLTGVAAPLSTSTVDGGEFRFLNLHPGEYTVTAALMGFATAVRPNVIVGSRQNAELQLTLRIAPREESVVVTGEPPLLDTRKSNVGVNVTKQELENIPTARDPWVILQSVPGIKTDRVNVGGSESGMSSFFIGKGSSPTQNAWIMEGIVFQSMALAAGSGVSVEFYDFDSLEEIQVATGGTDPSTQTPGVQVTLITKRGTNDLRGSARFLLADERWQATNIPEELANQLAAGGASVSGNSISGMQDYGAEAGGPLLHDRLWLWGAYSHNQIDLLTAGGLTDKTTLENLNLKLNAQPFKNNSATLLYFRGDRTKLGRDAGITRPQETSWDMTGPTDAFKIEDSHVFSENAFATIAGAYKGGAYWIVPEGSGQMRQDSAQVFHNTYYTGRYDWPDSQIGANMSYFLRTGRLSHEIKLGGLYRYSKVINDNLFEGNVVACNTSASWCGSQSEPSAELNRDLVVNVLLDQYSGYISDTITVPRLTVNLGLRYDYQKGTNGPLSVQGSTAVNLVPPGTVLPPALDAPAKDPGFEWKDWQPRIGATYSLDADQKTLVRASYARFVNTLYAVFIAPFSVAPPQVRAAGAGVVYPWNDRNGNNHVDAGELDTTRMLRYFGFDPADPTNVNTSINGVDPGFGSVKTNEILLGFDREVLPKLAVSLVATYRKMTNFDLSTGFGLTRSDYILSTTNYRENGLSTNPLCSQVGYACGTLPDGTRYNVPVYRVRPGATVSPGQYTRNNPDYDQTYYSVELQATKRFSNNWMARLSASYSDWRQHYGQDGFVDPTNIETYDGGLAVAPSLAAGDKSMVFLNGTWQVNCSAMYALPLGFSVAGNFFARQGYPLGYFQNVTANPNVTVAYERTKSLLVAPYQSYRLGTVSCLDLSIAKSLKVNGFEIKLTVDVFNVMNRNTVLQRQSQMGVAGPNGTNSIREVQSPRVARFGARVSF